MTFTTTEALVAFVRTAKLPDWQKQLFNKYAEEIQVHSKGKLFHKINTLFPNEQEDSKRLRLLSFEPITKASFNKGVSNIYRIFNNSSYSANVSETTLKFLLETKFDNKDLFTYFLELWSNTALRDDPNALIVVYPDAFTKDKNIDRVITIASEDVIYTDDNSFIFKSEIESQVEYALVTEQACMRTFYDQSIDNLNMIETAKLTYNQKLEKKFVKTVYHAFIDGKFYRISGLEDLAATVVTYSLGSNKLPPVTFAGGTQVYKNVYESFLSPFVHFGNLALLQHSQHTAVNFIFSFPRMSELQPVCDYPLCKNGFVDCEITDECPDGKATCHVCNGSGYKSVQSPYKTYVKRYDPTGFDEQSNRDFLNTDDVRYYTPPTGILTYSKEEWKDYLRMAETSVFIQQKVYTGQVQSAESKGIDLDELYAYLISVSKIFYDRLRFVLQSFENYLNSNPATVTVNIPYSFAILTEAEAFEALNKILVSNAPAIIKGSEIENFISKFVSEGSPVKKAYEILKQVDLLFLKSENELATLKSNNVIDTSAWIIHTYAYPLLMNMYELNKKLFIKPNQQIITELKNQLKSYQEQGAQSDLRKTLAEQFSIPADEEAADEEETNTATNE